MAVETISAQTSESSPIEFDYDFGDNLQDAVSKFGEEVVFAYLKRGLVVAAQGHARGMIKAEKTKDEIIAAMKDWRPGMPRATKSKEDRIAEMLDSLEPDARARLLKELKAPKAA